MASRRRAALLGILALISVVSTSMGGVATAVSARTASPLCQVADLLPSGSSSGLGYQCAEAGALLDLPIGDVRATQPSLGYDEVYYKLGRYTLGKDEINKKFDDWCEANGQEEAASASPDARLDNPSSFTCTVPVGQETPDTIAPMKTVVIGPGGVPYLTDGHHTLTSFYETADGGPNLHLRLRVVANLSDLSPTDFWARMKAEKWVWNYDVDGNEVPVEQLPSGVGLAKFQNDKYRSLMYFARDIGFTPGTIPFQEFYWGAWVRDSAEVDISGWDSNNLASYLSTVESVSRAQVAAPKDAVIDSGRTAAELGALASWNDGKAAGKGEFGKLSAPYSSGKPGKLAYALQYKSGLPR
ncbi:hypothetical protein RhoFasGS6_03799 [Rhodococcus fascians]|uniref:ParB-like protein n=1 Tax=Rhodococcoides fascians TaxID=1828 RepID=UPI001427E111|nr:hypothetical protein [Rhodococcus fascians]